VSIKYYITCAKIMQTWVNHNNRTVYLYNIPTYYYYYPKQNIMHTLIWVVILFCWHYYVTSDRRVVGQLLLLQKPHFQIEFIYIKYINNNKALIKSLSPIFDGRVIRSSYAKRVQAAQCTRCTKKDGSIQTKCDDRLSTIYRLPIRK